MQLNSQPVTYIYPASLRSERPGQIARDQPYDLAEYYREEVIYGPGAFVEIANDYDDFARAFLRKLRRELNPMTSQDNAAPRALIQACLSG